jgi:hypothetical protein
LDARGAAAGQAIVQQMVRSSVLPERIESLPKGYDAGPRLVVLGKSI